MKTSLLTGGLQPRAVLGTSFGILLILWALESIACTVEPGVSKLFGRRKNVYYPQVVYYLAGDLC